MSRSLHLTKDVSAHEQTSLATTQHSSMTSILIWTPTDVGASRASKGHGSDVEVKCNTDTDENKDASTDGVEKYTEHRHMVMPSTASTLQAPLSPTPKTC